MHGVDWIWLAAGLAAQAMFSARFLLQWLLSERARCSLLPVHFWYFSIIGAVLLLAYAVHRRDPVIATGQMLGLAIYLRNLRFIRTERPDLLLRNGLWLWLGLCSSALLAGYYLVPDAATRPLILHDFWTAFGFAGHSLFTGRFLIQWWSTERAQHSVVPHAFWYLSIAGSLMVFAYALAMHDPVIMIGQATGLIVYTRNLMLVQRSGGSYPSKLSTT